MRIAPLAAGLALTIGGIVGAVFIGGTLIEGSPPATAQDPGPSDTVDMARAEQLYQENCAACHGANLEGQPNWRSPGPDGILPAPPHDASGHTWHHDDAMLFDYTRLGGQEAMAREGLQFDSGMPGFGDVLSDAEIRAILDYIKSTWPARQRAAQAERDAAARQAAQ
ncbi:MAG: c-type cytochrome [Celeribacter sp.]